MSLKARIEDGIVHSPYPGGSVPKISVCQAIKERLVPHGERTALVSMPISFVYIVWKKCHYIKYCAKQD